MSWNAVDGSVEYSTGPAKPRPALAPLTRAQMPCHDGALALVPPMVSTVPPTTTSYPLSGSASRLTSGTPRVGGAVTPSTLALACKAAAGSPGLTPPPPAYQPISLSGLLLST